MAIKHKFISTAPPVADHTKVGSTEWNDGHTDIVNADVAAGAAISESKLNLNHPTHAPLTPGGTDKQVQYNDSGVLSGDANFTWDKTNRILTMIDNGSTLPILQAGFNGVDAGTILVKGGDGISGDMAGGDTYVNGGLPHGNGNGGNLSFSAANSTGGNGGSVDFVAGHGVQGGIASFYAGSSTGGNNPGGIFGVVAGDGHGSGHGGNVAFASGTGGATNGNGGDIIFQLGPGGGAGAVGRLAFFHPTSGRNAFVDISNIASTDKTFALPNASGTFALLETNNVFMESQRILKSGAATFEVETSGSTVSDAAELLLTNPSQSWRFYTGYGTSDLLIQDATNAKFPFKIASAAPDNSLVILTSDGFVGMGTPAPAVNLHVYNGVTFAGMQLETGHANDIAFISAKNPNISWNFETGRNGAHNLLEFYNPAYGSVFFMTPEGLTSIGREIYGRYDQNYPSSGAGYYRIATNNIDGTSGGIGVSWLNAGTFVEGFRLPAGGNFLLGTTTDGMTAGGSLAIAKDLAHRGTLAGFYNVAPVARQLLATGVLHTPDDIITALQNLGLVKQA